MSEDFYEVLGVSRDASEDEIQQAFRKQAAKHHPDVSDEPDAEQRFKKIRKAKEVLTDKEKRQAYDRMGHEQFEQAERHGGFDEGRGSAGAAGASDPFGGMGGMGGMGDINDIFENLFGGGGGRRRRQGPQPGRDIEGQITIDLEDAYEGVEKEITLRRPERCETCGGEGHPPDADVRTCPECDGRGQVTRVQQTPFGRVQQTGTCQRCEGSGEIFSKTCPDCGGEGIRTGRSTISVDIPAGIRDGQTIRISGEGEPGEPGAEDGDLIVEVRVSDHDDFDREGDDLATRTAVSFPTLVFGGTATVETIDGTVELEIPSGTQSGETFRLEGKGMPNPRGRRRGDLYVTVRVVTPRNLTDEQRDALEAYAEAGGETVEVDQGFFERLKSSF